MVFSAAPTAVHRSRHSGQPPPEMEDHMSMIGAVSVASACVLRASVVGGLLWAKNLRANGEYSYQGCPKCRQRLRFQVRKAGRPGQCPRCHSRFTLTADAFAVK